MNYPFIRRAAALALALVFALTLPVSLIAPARAAEADASGLSITGEGVSGGKLTLESGKTAKLTATWADAPEGVEYTWSCSKGQEFVSLSGKSGKAAEEPVTGESVTLTAIAEGEATITLTAAWTEKAEDAGEATPARASDAAGTPKSTNVELTVTVKAKEDDSGGGSTTVEVTNVTLDRSTLSLTEGSTATLTATVKPEDATDSKVTWKSSNDSIATVKESDNFNTEATITARKAGTVTITATAGGKSASCTVTVSAPTPMLSIAGNRSVTMDPGTLTLTATLTNPPSNAKIKWSVARVSGQTGTKLPKAPTTKDGKVEGGITSTAEYVFDGPGEFIITAQCGDDLIATKSVTISGIVLSGDGLNIDDDTLIMYVNGSAALTATPYGNANDRSADVLWTSSDSIVVSVMPDSGSLNAWTVGEATITVKWGDYTANCTVTVAEDKSVVAEEDLDGNRFTASVSKPLNFLDSGLYEKLEDICLTKTEQLGAKAGLSYITNLKVSPDQGTLYYNYSTDSDTGDGVGYADQFAETPIGVIRSVGRLSFVPVQGFTGTAEITFSIVSGSRNFAGTIRVEVGSGLDKGEDGEHQYHINYGARSGEAVWFQTSDFNAFCQNVSGRNFNYIVFNLPRSSEGTLYYNYMAGSGNPVTTTLQFSQAGRYTVDDVCFVPNAAFEGRVTISFRAVDTSGTAINGTVIVNVTAINPSNDSFNVLVTGERNQPVTLLSSAFHDACQATIGDTLSFVTFRLPDPAEGTMYYNYRSDGTFDSRVTASTRYYFSGVPGLSSVTFVPAPGVTGRIAIPYIGYGSGGASYSGTLYIMLEDTDRSTIYYSVAKGGSVTFSAWDFYYAGQYLSNSSVSYVVFRTKTDTPGTDLGTLYYNNSNTKVNLHDTAASSSYRYYRSSTGSQKGLSRVFFQAKDTAGTVTLTYDAYSSSNQKLFRGTVVIQVGSRTPEDINLSCKTGGQAWLSTPTLDSVCSGVMSGSLSYIEITSVPSAEKGRLYLNYSSFGTGTAVEQGDRFYRIGTPSINQISFVPFARFTGEAEITYIGYSIDGKEQVSGRIVVNVTSSTSSQYFDDMGNYAWAIDSVDYLRRNGTVNGISSHYFGPSGTVKRGDFVLMLVRAYHLTASGSVSFNDVPNDTYYADAIRIAALLGIVGGTSGNFYPEEPLIRQDAMMMLYKTLQVSGKTTTNGLVADLSGYADAGEIRTDAKEAIGSLVQMGVVKGNGGGYLWPNGKLARAEAAILLHTIMTL